MGKASSNKKVARVAGTSGGRTARGRTPWMWYSALSLVVLLGTVGVISSRSHLNPKIDHPNFSDHWHMAYGIYICGQFKPNMPQPATLIGLHTHTDGLIHVEPQSTLDTAKGATVGRYVSGQPGFHVSATSIQYPGDKALKNGDKCNGKASKVQVKEWTSKSDNSGETVTGDPKNIKVENLHLITIAFVPLGTTIPKPPSQSNLADPNAGETGSPGPSTTVPAGATTVPSTPAPTSAPTTAAPK